MLSEQLLHCGPNIIGATGGSGTRVFARIVRHGGLFIGTHVNDSEDAVGFGEYSDRWINTYIPYRNSSLPPAIHSSMLRELKDVLDKHCAPLAQDARPWGWKEPRSIYLLRFFHSLFPDLRFLHVVRDGRDMAYSSNQNQLRKHGRTLLGFRDKLRNQALQSIALWSRVNLLAAEYGKTHLGKQYLRVRFEDLCGDPIRTVEEVLGFLGLQGDAGQIAGLEVLPPASLGRWRGEATAAKVSQIGVEALQRFGYVL